MNARPPEVLQEFIDAARALWREPLSDAARWRRMGGLAPMLLNSERLRALAQSWPEPPAEARRARNLLFYQDPDYHFVVNGLVKRPMAGTPVHDHAHTWTVYGVLAGEERILRYRRVEGAAAAGPARLEKTADYLVKPGFVDLVPPRMLHAEYAGRERTVAVILRSERVGDFPQQTIEPTTGQVTEAPGPEQIPYRL